MLRVIIIILILCPAIFAQNVSLGLHGCAAWSKFELDAGWYNAESDNHELFYGGGADITIKPALSPIGIEAGATFLIRTETENDIESQFINIPLYANGKLFLSPMMYVAGGINYTIWKIEVDGDKIEDLKGKMGFQFGGGIEMGAGSSRLYISAYYVIMKGEIEPAQGDVTELESKSLQVRAGLRFGG